MQADKNILTTLEDGVLLAVIDMPGRSMNVVSWAMLDSLEALIDQVEQDERVKAVVLTSGKKAFLAGADLEMIHMFIERAHLDTPAQFHERCNRGGYLFRRLETSRKPYVAAINGLALGGGLEICLACHARIAADDRSVQLGLPEVKLGLLPGAGGTQRLPRLIGIGLGMGALLSGDAFTPAQALACGLVDKIVAPGDLLPAAKTMAVGLQNPQAPWDRAGATFDSAPFDFTRSDVIQEIAKTYHVTGQQLTKYPAYRAIIDCVVGGWNRPIDEGIRWEMDCFVKLIRDPVAGNMVRTLFLNRQKAAKVGSASSVARRVSVIGEPGEALRRQLQEARVDLIPAAALEAEDIALLLPGAASDRGIAVAWLELPTDTPAAVGAAAGIWLSAATVHGRAAEVLVTENGAQASDAAMSLARQLRASILATNGQRAVLPGLRSAQQQARAAGCPESAELLCIALQAARSWEEGSVADVDLVDVAAVVSGLHPAYSGGPFNYLRQCGIAALREQALTTSKLAPDLFRLPPRLDGLLA